MLRADQFLVAKGLAQSRTEAQSLIEAGRVFLLTANGKELIKKSSQKIAPKDALETAQIEITPGERFVSRGGIKMQGALERTQLKVQEFRVLDIGISTGGFADCLLQAGAQLVVGVDVGHGQLAPKLRTDKRVHLLEGVNARDLSQAEILAASAGQTFDLLVVDVSFISLELVLPEAIQYLKESAFVLTLVKPQFEVGREGLGKNGIVKEARLWDQVREKTLRLAQSLSLHVEDYFESSIEGGDGNREFFLFARRL